MDLRTLPKTLTKTAFKLAAECPQKLAYVKDPRYVSTKVDDELLEGLACSGYKVGALAQRMFPGGVEVTEHGLEEQVDKTKLLLANNDVTVFEGTVRVDNLVVRVDILRKNGEILELIEVKSKGFDPNLTEFFGKNGQLLTAWRPYLIDVAFQYHVLQRAYPKLTIKPYLMLIDTTAKCSIDGLGSMFAVRLGTQRGAIDVDENFDVTQLNPPLLSQRLVETDVIKTIDSVRFDTPTGALGFIDFVNYLGATLADGLAPGPLVDSRCKKCEFYCDPGARNETVRSGWAECMADSQGTPVDVSRAATVFGLYRDLATDKWLRQGVFLIADLCLTADEPTDGISLSQRQYLQVKEARTTGMGWVVTSKTLGKEINSWNFPRHFIDFETARPVLPFHRGSRPNQQLWFQFSHHRVTSDDRVSHQTEALCAGPGTYPNVAMARHLFAALGKDEGAVIHWWEHERTVLREIRAEVEESTEVDKKELLTFLDGLLGKENESGRLKDLGRLVEKTVYLPGTGGSSSIKKVLLALLTQSLHLQARYGAPVYGTPEMPSLNFKAQTWCIRAEGALQDPYHLLKPLLGQYDPNGLAKLAEDEGSGDASFVANGGAAMLAYERLMDPCLPARERKALESQLKRYCELDTLAMVMVYEGLNELLLASQEILND
ncbi:MAG: hypothetical protein JW395_2707 [Nitrospira sp.]|nr:hypothetical protein [Nitrospira sp.]